MLSHWNLNPACLPIPPQAHIVCIIAHDFLRGKTYHYLPVSARNRDTFWLWIISVSAGEIEPIEGKVCLYQGDITLLAVDAIVNACNRRLLGCFAPGCHCVDNAIHSFAGLQVRRDLMKVMKEQGHDEPNGKCKVTKGYNLPAKYVFHTVGPIYSGSEKDAEDLKSCYESCLRKANEMGLSSLAFCSLSTGVFGYPNEEAAAIAVGAVRAFLSSENRSLEKVVFCVFSERDRRAYQALLSPKESFPAE